MPVLLVRHAVALSRGSWSEGDEARPLNDRGRRQAEGLIEILSSFHVVRVASSPAVRCAETVAPLAAGRSLKVSHKEELSEGHGREALALVAALMAEKFGGRKGDAAVLCSHGDVIPEVLWALEQEGASLGDDARCQKGSTWVLERRARGGVRGRYLPPLA